MLKKKKKKLFVTLAKMVRQMLFGSIEIDIETTAMGFLQSEREKPGLILITTVKVRIDSPVAE